jgi:hypothetical protein
MTFGQALELLKTGERVALAEWIQEGRWIYLIGEMDWSIPRGPAMRALQFTTDRFLPWIGMRLPNRAFGPWVPSHADLLAENWEVVTT